jgi:hypothetical protein
MASTVAERDQMQMRRIMYPQTRGAIMDEKPSGSGGRKGASG